MPPVWPKDQIRELLALAASTGAAKAELATLAEAKSFRFAIYYFRRQNQIGLDLSVTIEQAVPNGSAIVVVTKRTKPEVQILQEAE